MFEGGFSYRVTGILTCTLKYIYIFLEVSLLESACTTGSSHQDTTYCISRILLHARISEIYQNSDEAVLVTKPACQYRMVSDGAMGTGEDEAIDINIHAHSP